MLFSVAEVLTQWHKYTFAHKVFGVPDSGSGTAVTVS